MYSIDLIRDNLLKSRDRVLSRIEEMCDHGLVFPTPSGGCHTIWVLGHLAYIEGLVIREFMLGETNPLGNWSGPFDGVEIGDDPDQFPSFDRVLAACRDMRSSTLELLESFQEKDLDRISANTPNGFQDTFGTYRLCFQYVSDHWYMHRGQLADARRAAGIDKMWF